MIGGGGWGGGLEFSADFLVDSAFDVKNMAQSRFCDNGCAPDLGEWVKYNYGGWGYGGGVVVRSIVFKIG